MKWKSIGTNSIQSGEYVIHRREPKWHHQNVVSYALYHGANYLGTWTCPDRTRKEAFDHEYNARRRGKLNRA